MRSREKENPDLENSTYVSTIIRPEDTLHLQYDKHGRLSRFVKRLEGEEVDYTDLHITYQKHTVTMKGAYSYGQVKETFELDSVGRAETFALYSLDGLMTTADVVFAAFDYNYDGFLRAYKTEYYYDSHFIKERATRFNISKDNIIEIVDDTHGSQTIVSYGVENNRNNLWVIAQFWDSDMLLPAFLAGIMGKSSANMPTSAVEYSRRDPRVRFNYKLGNYSEDNFGNVLGWQQERTYSQSEDYDNKLYYVKYYSVKDAP